MWLLGMPNPMLWGVLAATRSWFLRAFYLIALWVGGWMWGVAGVLFTLPALVAAKAAASHSANGETLVRFLSPHTTQPQIRVAAWDSRNGAAQSDTETNRGWSSR
jgi:predicted PurR-regulated permease PerM